MLGSGGGRSAQQVRPVPTGQFRTRQTGWRVGIGFANVFTIAGVGAGRISNHLVPPPLLLTRQFVTRRRSTLLAPPARYGPWPPARHAGIMVDDSGLWIVWNSKDTEWTQRRAPMSPPLEVPPRRVWEGWVELVDPSTGRTLARHRSDGFIKGFADGSRYLVGYCETDRGVPYIHLLAPKVSKPPPAE